MLNSLGLLTFCVWSVSHGVCGIQVVDVPFLTIHNTLLANCLNQVYKTL